MCGIFGAVSTEPVANTLVEGLRRLEYRGYDSAGIATIHETGLHKLCAVGKVSSLAAKVVSARIESRIGIGHTRWATHGAPTAANSHPHLAPGFAVVHNGIVENHHALRTRLKGAGCRFASETDTEVIPWLIAQDVGQGSDLPTAMRNLSSTLEGSFAVAVLAESDPNRLYAKRCGSPLLAAIGDKGGYVTSDSNALIGLAREAVVLEDHDSVVLDRQSMTITDRNGRRVNRQAVPVAAGADVLSLGRHSHFMHKEIHEQFEVAHRIEAFHGSAHLGDAAGIDFRRVMRIRMVACGTSLFACMVARRWFTELAGIPVEVEIASEFSHMPLIVSPGDLAILVSQSGETADTLAALCRLRAAGVPTLGVVNQEISTLAREATFVAPLLAGPEIGVASTKAFMAQLLVLGHIAAKAGRQCAGGRQANRLRRALAQVPALIDAALRDESEIQGLADRFARAQSALVVGRGHLYPLALEAALKLKETSYIHAEGFAAGELKHGPLALIERETPVVALAPFGSTFAKMASNVREIAARGGRILVITDERGAAELDDIADRILLIPRCDELVQPMATAVPLQLLAYHVAVLRGCDVDRPRNLAKSVTVE